MSITLGIDLGTQSVKVVCYDTEARQYSAIASAPLPLHQTADGVAEQEADWWIGGLRAALQQVGPGIRQSVTAETWQTDALLG